MTREYHLHDFEFPIRPNGSTDCKTCGTTRMYEPHELMKVFGPYITDDLMERIMEQATYEFPDHHPETAKANFLAGREVWDTNGDLR